MGPVDVVGDLDNAQLDLAMREANPAQSSPIVGCSIGRDTQEIIRVSTGGVVVHRNDERIRDRMVINPGRKVRHGHRHIGGQRVGVLNRHRGLAG